MGLLDSVLDFFSDKPEGPPHPTFDPSRDVIAPASSRSTDKTPEMKDGVLTVPSINRGVDLPAGWEGRVPPDLVSDIPQSLLAMAPPTLTDQQIENLEQIKDLQGPPSTNPVAQRIERLALFDGAVRMPTSNDSRGHSLGIEGCAKTPIEKVLAPVAKEYPVIKLPPMNSTTVENARVFLQWLHKHPGIADTYDLKLSEVRGSELRPGDMLIAHKGPDVHTLIAARVPKSWNWPPGTLILVANTGLSHDSRGDNLGPPAMILAQEYIRAGLPEPETRYNNHGPINGPGTFRERNPYYGSANMLTIIRFRNPDGTPSSDGAPPNAILTSAEGYGRH